MPAQSQHTRSSIVAFNKRHIRVTMRGRLGQRVTCEIIVDHQWEFARALAETGKIILAEQPADLPRAVAEALKRRHQSQSAATEPPLVASIREKLRQYAERLHR